jgi:hypothetical protein
LLGIGLSADGGKRAAAERRALLTPDSGQLRGRGDFVTVNQGWYFGGSRDKIDFGSFR